SGADSSVMPAESVHLAATLFVPGSSGTVASNSDPLVRTFTPTSRPLSSSDTPLHDAVPLTCSVHANASPPRTVKATSGFWLAEGEAVGDPVEPVPPDAGDVDDVEGG